MEERLFLDEVGDIPVEMQVKLLRALEHGVFTPVGSSDPVTSDFRVVSATNADLVSGIESGSFRHDLFYRLAAFRIEIPPLRDRGDDVVQLAKQFAASMGDGTLTFSPAAEQEILRRKWYGNVRELRNAVEHAVVVARRGCIEPRHLPEPLVLPFPVGGAVPNSKDKLSESIQSWVEARLSAGDSAAKIYADLIALAERPLVVGTLARHGGNYSAAAKDLGIHRTTLRKKAIEQDLDTTRSDDDQDPPVV